MELLAILILPLDIKYGMTFVFDVDVDVDVAAVSEICVSRDQLDRSSVFSGLMVSILRYHCYTRVLLRDAFSVGFQEFEYGIHKKTKR